LYSERKFRGTSARGRGPDSVFQSKFPKKSCWTNEVKVKKSSKGPVDKKRKITTASIDLENSTPIKKRHPSWEAQVVALEIRIARQQKKGERDTTKGRGGEKETDRCYEKYGGTLITKGATKNPRRHE